jgi:putative FmdB family regulatory protein
MPTYQYRCTACGHDLEAVQKFSDSALTVCPNCGGSLRKIFNAVGVVFKGSGFYRTDSRAASNGDSTGSGDGAKSESAAAGGSGSDGKGSEGKKPEGDKAGKPAKENAVKSGSSSTSSNGGGAKSTSSTGSSNSSA